MAKKFLITAENILRELDRPLSAKDIVDKALSEGILRTKGITPVNTMRARISEEIRLNKQSSKFIRIKANKFALREWNYDEYQSKPYQLNKDDEIVACIRQDTLEDIGRFFGFNKKFDKYKQIISDPNNICFIRRGDADRSFQYKQLISYVILRDSNGRFLSYVRGNFSQKDQLLKGVLCIGFGGHVNSVDFNLFAMYDGGVSNSAYREVFEEVKGLIIDNLTLVGVINDDSSNLGFRHFAFVYESKLPNNFDLNSKSKEISINQLKLRSKREIWKQFSDLEFWSQLTIKYLTNPPKDFEPVFVKIKDKNEIHYPLIVVGEIGSGKSELAGLLSDELSLKLISTRQCVADIIQLKDFGVRERKPFQEKAMQLIKSTRGIKKLAEKIKSEINREPQKKVIVDGVRNIETFELLKKHFKILTLVYIEAPRDVAFKFYKDRNGIDATIHTFREDRNHDVEKEITLFKSRADIYIFNGGSIKQLSNKIKQVWLKNSSTK
jgi:predicted NUDIX family phosphoesterase/dephospho-CoA kinase